MSKRKTLKQLSDSWRKFAKAMDTAHRGRWELHHDLITEQNGEAMRRASKLMHEAESILRTVVEPRLGQLYREDIEK